MSLNRSSSQREDPTSWRWTNDPQEFRREASYTIYMDKSWQTFKPIPPNPTKIQTRCPTPNEIQDLRQQSKQRKQALTRSGIEFTCADEYDRSGMYSSQSQRVHVPYKASLPKPPTVPGSAEKVLSKEEERNKPPPQNTEATWLKRNVDRLDVEDMPSSGSAEYPNYVAARTPSHQEIKANMDLSRARKKELTKSNVTDVFIREDETDPGQKYVSEAMSNHRPLQGDKYSRHSMATSGVPPGAGRAIRGEGGMQSTHRMYKDNHGMRVPELPQSGCAENPTNVVPNAPQATELALETEMARARKAELTASSLEIGSKDINMQGLYVSQLLFSQHKGPQPIDTSRTKYPHLSRESKLKSIQARPRSGI